jgi:aminoglycoside phosphotransferase (APT) family kinase protein
MNFPEVDRVHDLLETRIPPQQGAAIVHGDYRLDNCMLAADGSIAAVLDWEICTLGDPLADVGLLWVYWADPDDPAALPQSSSTALDGFLRRTELMERYATVSGRDLSNLDFYIAFGYWKLTCIIAGVYARYAGGAMGSGVDQRQVDGFAAMVESLAALAGAAADGVAS